MPNPTKKLTPAGQTSGLSVIAGSESVACAATPREELLRQILDSRIPKNEREWCAAREIEELRKGIAAALALIEDSYGVAGLHLNGDVAPWHELRTGGRYEDWLFDFDQAVERLPPNTQGLVTPGTGQSPEESIFTMSTDTDEIEAIPLEIRAATAPYEKYKTTGFFPFEVHGERFAVTRRPGTDEQRRWHATHIETGSAVPGTACEMSTEVKALAIDRLTRVRPEKLKAALDKVRALIANKADSPH